MDFDRVQLVSFRHYMVQAIRAFEANRNLLVHRLNFRLFFPEMIASRIFLIEVNFDVIWNS